MLFKKYIIEEKVFTSTPAKKVWRAWQQMNNLPTKKEKINAFKSNKKIVVDNGKGGKTAFKIFDVIEEKSFKMMWYSFLVNMTFFYTVEQQKRGSLIDCKVAFGGMFGWVTKLFIKNKVKKELSNTLKEFVYRLEMQR